MSYYPILHRWSATPLALVEAASFARALEQAVDRRVKLRYADLRGLVAPGVLLAGAELGGADLSNAILPGAKLQAAELRSARLAGTFLQEALLRLSDLRDADLRRADLRAANLEEARLVGADLRGALFYGSRLTGAILDWRWGSVPLELLRQGRDGGDDPRHVAINPEAAEDQRPFAWLKALLAQGSKADRALEILARHIRPGDNAPELLRRLTADVPPEGCTSARTDVTRNSPDVKTVSPMPASSPMLWIRRRADREKPIVCRFG
jgi:Pentapeptide repeats (8 copies)